MSSHHVVREKQEPALLVLGLNNFSDEMLGQLLEWSPTVITSDDIAQKLAVYGIKVDYIVGKEAVEVSQSDLKQLDPGDDTVTRSALKFLVDNEYPSVYIITDDLDLDEIKPFVGLINLVIFHDRKKIYPVNSGFSKWQPAGVCVEILNIAASLHFTGLQPIHSQRYITVGDGFFTLCFDDDFIFIAEEV